MSNASGSRENSTVKKAKSDNAFLQRREAKPSFNESESDLDTSAESTSSILAQRVRRGATQEGNRTPSTNTMETVRKPQTSKIGKEPPNVVHTVGGQHDSTIHTNRSDDSGILRGLGEPISSSPAGHIDPSRRPNPKQVQLADPPLQVRNAPIQAPPRTSTPINENLLIERPHIMEDLANQLEAVGLNDTATLPSTHVPEYLPPSEQIKKIHNIELAESQQQAHQSGQLSKLLAILTAANPDQHLKALSDEVKKEADEANLKVEQKKTRIANANKIVEYYKSPITRPICKTPPAEYKKTYHRTSPKEITSLTGFFDPANSRADFSHMWSKLLGYGQANYFTESEYKDALRCILQGDAYDSFLSFDQGNQSLEYMLDYFGKVYSPKRSLNAHRQAVDNFTRNKNETLEVAMHRCLVAIDRLRIQYPTETWPETRVWLRKNILTQVVTEDTRRFIRAKEDDVMESFGIPLDIDQIITLAHKYEIQHNKAPRTEMSTLFQVASGGISEEPQKMKSELSHLKKEAFTEKNLKNTLLEILTSNPVMARRFSADKERDSRQRNREDERHSRRQSRFDQNRQLTPESRPMTPIQGQKAIELQAQPIQGPPVQRFPKIPQEQRPMTYPARDSSLDRMQRAPTPIMDYRGQDRYRNRSPSFDGRNNRYQSQDRYRDYKRNQLSQSRQKNSPDREFRSRQYQSGDRYEGKNTSSQNNYNASRNNSYNRGSYYYNDQNAYGRNSYQDRQRSRDNSQSRYQRPPYYREQRSLSRDRNRNSNPSYRNRSASRDRYDRNARFNNEPSFRSYSDNRDQRQRQPPNEGPTSPQPPQQVNRNGRQSPYQRPSSRTTFEDISSTAKLVTVNINGIGFNPSEN